jgi:hypothetical protein
MKECGAIQRTEMGLRNRFNIESYGKMSAYCILYTASGISLFPHNPDDSWGRRYYLS